MLSLLAVALLGGAFLFLWPLRGVWAHESKTPGALPRRGSHRLGCRRTEGPTARYVAAWLTLRCQGQTTV
jgi:hypothetical protein